MKCGGLSGLPSVTPAAVLGPAAPACRMHLLECRSLGPPLPTGSQSLGMGPRKLLSQVPQVIPKHLKLENPWIRK